MTRPKANDEEDWEQGFCPMVTATIPEGFRVSCVLGPDGEPVTVPVPRFRAGFDLTKTEVEEA